MNFEFLTPKMIVDELNKYIVGQYEAKKAVAIALRNRIRRMKLPEKMRKEVIPKNILMIGPTGVGKTEIARRLAQIADAPFIKVEATRFTEVGYVGKNVDSMIRELVDVSVNMVKNEMIEKVKKKAEELVIDKLTDIILSGGKPKRGHRQEDMMMEFFQQIFSGMQSRQSKYTQPPQENQPQRDEIKRRLIRGDFDEMEIEIDVEEKNVPMVAGLGPELEDMGIQLGEMFSSLLPKRKVRRRMKVKEAKKLLLPMEAEKLIDMDKVVREGIERAQNRGIIFIDEIDKVASRGSKSGPDVSREGVQRDLLPIVEGTTIMTKYGPVRTDYILFIAAGAFHTSKPSDLIPELQGRFPIRVELNALTKEDFIRILTEPENAIIKQYKALLETEDVELEFTDDGIEEIAEIAFQLNEKMENIGARRLYTVVEKVMEDISFNAPFGERKKIIVDKEYVRKRLHSLLSDKEEIFYIL